MNLLVGPGFLGQAVDAVSNGETGLLGAGQAGFFMAGADGVTGGVIGTTTAPGLYNPLTSGKVARILKVAFGDVSGTLIRANLRYYWLQNVAGAGGPTITAGSSTAGTIPTRSHAAVASVCTWYTALTVSAAATVHIPVGLGSGGTIAAQFYRLDDTPDGSIVVNPGEIWYPFVSNAAWAGLADIGVIWIETPILQGS